jgi:hypothetical protein
MCIICELRLSRDHGKGEYHALPVGRDYIRSAAPTDVEAKSPTPAEVRKLKMSRRDGMVLEGPSDPGENDAKGTTI